MLKLTLATPPRPDMYRELSYEGASRTALEICKLAVETGRTINASYHLDALREIMLREFPKLEQSL